MKRISLVFLVVGLMAPVAFGDTVFVDDDFESYDDYGAGTNLLHNTWVPQTPPGVEYGLADSGTSPDAFPVAGQGGGHVGGPVAIYQSTSAFTPIAPDADSKVVLRFDMYDDGVGNKRMTIGLRESSGIANLFELGRYNVGSALNYAVRALSFDSIQYPAHHDTANNGWFGITDLVDDSGTPIDPPALGQNSVVTGWHTFMAEFYTDHFDITLDLNRDGNINAVNTIQYNGFNLAGFGGFEQIRFGGPSALSSGGGGAVFDNIYLALEDFTPVGLPGDFNEDDVVDAADYVVWRANETANNSLPNDNGAANQAARYTLWVDNFGGTLGSAGGLSPSVVPEPTTLALVLLGMAAVAGRRRRNG